MDGGHVVREPLRQVDVGHRAALGTVAFGKFRERTPKPVAREHQGLGGDDATGDADALVCAPCETRVEDIDHARLDRHPGERMEDLDRHNGGGPRPDRGLLWHRVGSWPPRTPPWRV